MNASSKSSLITVAAGIVARDRKILVSKRLPGSHLEGTWEFPGGKIEPGEAPEDTLRRELTEELGLAFGKAVLFHRQEHVYTERTVDLFFYLCLEVQGIPTPAAQQDIRWVTIKEIHELRTPPANKQVIELLESHLEF